jgi:hypothetical protein
MQENYSGYIPEDAENPEGPEKLILVIELSPSIGSAQVQECINTFEGLEPIILPFTYKNEGDKTLIFVSSFYLFIFGSINVTVCDTDIQLLCVNCNIPISPFPGVPSIAVITPEEYNDLTGGNLELTYPNLIFGISSICGTFNGVTRLYNDTIDVSIVPEDENLYILSPLPLIYLNIIKTNTPIPGLPVDPPPTEQEIIDAINALNNTATTILAEGTMVNSCEETQPIVMYESFFGRSMRYQTNGTRSSLLNVLKGKLSDKSVLPWFKKT